jgi:hypothetical protein
MEKKMQGVPEMQAQIRVFREDMAQDEEEFTQRFKTRKIKLEYPYSNESCLLNK